LHGELLEENRYYTYPGEKRIPALVEAPWLEIKEAREKEKISREKIEFKDLNERIYCEGLLD
jgi:hypothetical protein